MAASKKGKNKVATIIQVPECPVCLEDMTAPILQCKTGHSLCSKCTAALHNGLCPICREVMTAMRNWQLEELIGKAKVTCPNQQCVYKVASSELNEHLKECIFREMTCPLGAANGKCSWKGMLKDIVPHFEERHPTFLFKMDENVLLNNINATEDELLTFVSNQGKFIFLVTFRLNTQQKVCYFTVQNFGTKTNAHNIFYEIQIISCVDNRRQILFRDHCFNDSIKADDIFGMGKCVMIPLALLPHFVKDYKMKFQLNVSRVGVPPVPKNMNKLEPKDNNSERSRSHSRGPNPRPFANFRPKPGFSRENM